MAKNNKKTVNHRNKNQTKNKQFYNQKTKLWYEKDSKTGKIIDVKTSSSNRFKKVK